MKTTSTPSEGHAVATLDRADEPQATGSGVVGSHPGFRLKKILVPIDFSDCARKALRYALPFAREFGAQIVLLHVIQPAFDYGSEFGPTTFPELESEWRVRTEGKLQALAGRELGGDIAAQTFVRVGQPAEEILAAAGALDVDLVIISTHGRTGLKHALLGSQTERVVQRAPCPVLTVREHEHEFITG